MRVPLSLLVLLLPFFLLVRPPVAYGQGGNRPDRVGLPRSIRPVGPVGAASSVPASLVRPTLSAVEAATPLRVDLVLHMRNFEELERRASAGETISRAEMAERFLPLESDHRAVAQWLVSRGLTVAPPGASHAVVSASGTPDLLRQAFQTGFARVAFRNAEYTAAVESPSLPTDIADRVANIHGLQPYLHPHKSGRMREVATGSGISPPYLVNDVLTAYNAQNTGLTGAGQQIGVVIDTVPLSSDLTQFWTANGVSQSLSNIITVNVLNSTQLTKTDGEETLDVAWSSGLAPGAQIIIYACGDLENVNACFSRILDDLQDGSRPGLHQVSMSFGGGEETDETPDDMNSVHQMYTAMTAYGVSLFAASGDDGSNADGDRTVQVLYPASDPVVTGVGGTSLYLNPDTGAVDNEEAWSPDGSSDNNSSGGGISGFFPRPSWQIGSTVPAGSRRLVPDVAFDADPNTGCFLVYKGKAQDYGGTSWSAPCWAALCALVNQARATGGQQALTGANPSLYPLLGTASFRDITSGNNGSYEAGTGYDLMTGLGVPKFGTLLASLQGTTVTITRMAPAFGTIPAVRGVMGEAFAYQITASNSPATFGAADLPDGLSVNPATGLISGSPSATGIFIVTLSATNAAGTGTTGLALTIAPSSDPVVILTASEPQALLNDDQAGEFTLSIANAVSSDVKVSYTLKGSAINGTDYAYLKGFTKIKAGRTSKAIRVVPQGNVEGAGKKVIKLKLAPGEGYTIGTTGVVKVSILID